jgi:gamma-glutamyl-gamma-aminobutyrate hydrolase PuuD
MRPTGGGPGLEVEAPCAADGIVERVRHRSHPWYVGVRYRPEPSLAYGSLFRTFA